MDIRTATPDQIAMVKFYNGQLKKSFAEDELQKLMAGTVDKELWYWFDRYLDHHNRMAERAAADREKYLRSPCPMAVAEKLKAEFDMLKLFANKLRRDVDVLYILLESKGITNQEEIDFTAEMRDARLIGNKCDECSQVRDICGQTPQLIGETYKRITDESVKNQVMNCKGFTIKKAPDIKVVKA